MGKYFGDEKAKKAPKGNSGASVESGLSMHGKMDAMNVRSAGTNTEQARCERKFVKAGDGYMFDGNSN